MTDAELKSIWLACSGVPSGNFESIVKLLLLTGQRKSEIANLQNSWIKDDKITFPKEITKNATEHSIPVSASCAEIIAAMLKKRPSASGYIFSATTDTSKPFANWWYPTLGLYKAVGFDNFTIHDIRRSVASNMAALGVRIEVIEKILNHSGQLKGVAGIYNRHSYWDEMADAMTKWEAKLQKIVHGGAP